ncbi:MAG: glycosyltransferase family 2 protein [Alphaproteobacteria bacterium]|nr:glycosyltransferase family 2 protein [Alphaproteobacteria bacterium]
MNNKPEVSIIMPVYNVEKYVAESLDSVLNQTFKDFELICVNDGSVDNCWDIVKEYAASDKRIKLFDNGKNLGQSVSRNFGLDTANGNYIMFMDSDDFIHQQTIEIALYFIKKYDGDIVNWRIKHLWKKDDNIDNSLYEDFNKIDMKVSLNPILMFESGVMNSSCNKLFNRDIVGNTRFIEGVKFEDNAFVLELLYKKPKMVILDSQLYNYVCYNSGSSMRMRFSEKTFSDYNIVFRRIYDVWKDAPKAETKLIKDHLFKESKNFMRAIRKQDYPDNIRCAFANMIADMDSVGWLKMPKDLRKIDKIKHLIRLKYYIRKYANKKGAK